MKPLTAEWMQKAEADFDLASRESQVASPHLDAVCFHAQQAAEKYIKAVLQERDIGFPPVHDLPALVRLLSPPVDALSPLLSELAVLSQLAVSTRYPGYFADAHAARHAVFVAQTVRHACLPLLGSGTHA